MTASRWSSWRLLLMSGAIALGIGTLVFWQLIDSRAAIWHRAQTANTNLLATVSHVLERTLQSADRALVQSVGVVERAAAMSDALADNTSRGRFLWQTDDDQFMFPALPAAEYGIQLLLDNDGRILAASTSTPQGDWSFSDRSYFTVHRERADVGFYLGAPFLSSFDGQPSVAMSRRWNLPDGSFGGVVVQTMKLSMLNGLFASFELGPNSGINVFLADGSVVTRFPYTVDQIGSSLAGTANFQRFVLEKEGHFTGIAAIDRVERLYVFRSLGSYPVIVNVAQATDAILGGWRRNVIWLGGATLLLMFSCVGLALVAERGMRAHHKTALRLAEAERELRMVVDSVPVLVAYWDDGLVNRMANVAHELWFGLSPDEIRGRHLRDVVGPEVFEDVRPYLAATLSGRVQTFEYALRDATGLLRHTLTTYLPDWDKGRVKGIFVLITDISKRKRAEVALFEEKERFRVILESIKDGVITTDANGNIVYVNPTATMLTGWHVQEAKGRPVEDVLRIRNPEGVDGISQQFREALESRRAFRTKVDGTLVSRGGAQLHIEHSAAPIQNDDGQLLGAVVVFHDVGQVRAMANKMTHLAQHDALTGLPNRRRLDIVGRDTLTRALSENRLLAVLYLDLDGFKQVNDEYGHAVGDDLLVAVTHRLAARLRSSDTLYRQGGDEFIVLVGKLEHQDDAHRLADRLIESCAEPITVGGKKLCVTVSIGISFLPRDGSDLDTLIKQADEAMYVAKNGGKNRYACAGALAEAGTVCE